MDWDRLFKRYLWDDEKTPYLTPAPRLTRRQADYEVHFYAVLLGVLFAFVAVAASSAAGPLGRSPAGALYAFSVVCATVLFAFTKHLYAAIYCALTPLAALGWLFAYRDHASGIDFVLVLAIVLFWARYSLRVVSIGRHYPSLDGARAEDP